METGTEKNPENAKLILQLEEVMKAFKECDQMIVYYKPGDGHHPEFLPTREINGKKESALCMVVAASKHAALSLMNQLTNHYRINPLEVMAFAMLTEEHPVSKDDYKKEG